MRYLVLFVAIFAITACAREAEPPISPIAAATSDACGASEYVGLSGQDAGALERIYILGQVRILRPGRPFTEDLRPARLNFEIDDEDKIARVFCG